ncbi:transcription termination factor, mitochondrial [Phlebotomus argentipes]|uniref:transcription termination factor, mitochondrial n=1 Tax=Phlebotomus argentipes TaxID=94469 RepID=UPI002892A35F|nr:transcription termination factor, mitochondrial [Phlebotomus argentipes]
MIPALLRTLRNTSKRTSAQLYWRFEAERCGFSTLRPDLASADDDTADPTANQVFEDYRRKNILLIKLKALMRCSHTDAKRFIDSSKYLKTMEHNSILDSVRYLQIRKAPAQTIMENPWLLLQSKTVLRGKFLSLHAMNPRELIDFIPLLRMSSLALSRLVQKYEQESAQIPGKHRLYYISDRLEVEPKIVAKYLSTHQFMFYISLPSLFENLDIMMRYNIAPMNILKDLWAFRYNSVSIEFRLQRAQQAAVEKPMPWMVRCPKAIFDKSIQLQQENRALLGSNETTLDYLSERLGYDLETTKYIASKHPAVLRVRMTKVKEILDFLLLEAGYKPHDIAQVPRVLCHSLDTTKARLAELKEMGCVPSTLVIICKSQREFEKFVNHWLATRDKLGISENQK